MRDTLPTLTKEAMKAGDKARVAALRLVSAAMKEREIEARGQGREVTAEDEQAVLRKMVKQRNDSIAAYDDARRTDLADVERAELKVIEPFLARQLDEAGTRSAVEAAIAEAGASGPRDLGKVVAALKARHGGGVDLGLASRIAKASLAQAAA